MRKNRLKSYLLNTTVLNKSVSSDKTEKYNLNEDYGESVLLFLKDETLKRRLWRSHRIDALKKMYDENKIHDNLELKIVVGEFNSGAQETAKYAADNGFQVEVIGGPKVWCEEIRKIHNLLIESENVDYFSLDSRPINHFMIFNNQDLFIERYHKHNEHRETVGIEKANHELIQEYKIAFQQMKEHSRPMDPESVLKMTDSCYR